MPRARRKRARRPDGLRKLFRYESLCGLPRNVPAGLRCGRWARGRRCAATPAWKAWRILAEWPRWRLRKLDVKDRASVSFFCWVIDGCSGRIARRASGCARGVGCCECLWGDGIPWSSFAYRESVYRYNRATECHGELCCPYDSRCSHQHGGSAIACRREPGRWPSGSRDGRSDELAGDPRADVFPSNASAATAAGSVRVEPCGSGIGCHLPLNA